MGSETEIAETKTGTGRIGQIIVEKAAEASGTFEGYIANAERQSVTLDSDVTKNVIIFYYSKPESLQYKVQYVYNDNAVYTESGDNGNGEGWRTSKVQNFRVYPSE